MHPKNQVRFWTVKEAKDAGYRRAANDHYGPGTGKAMEGTEGAPRHGPSRLRQSPSPTDNLASQFRRLARHLAPEEETPRGGTLRVRLHDEERERDQGLGF